MTPLLELRQLTRRFGEFTALDGVDLTLNPGEIVGLLGENGAGKSTLMNIVSGVLAPSGGELRWNGAPISFGSAREATRAGIGIVHQHFMLVPVFTVAENVALHALQGGAFYNAALWEQQVAQWAASLGWKVDGARRVAELSVGERQRVEILKALYNHGGGEAARLLLLDEPTANLTPLETAELFNVLRQLREQGLSIVFVSHKLNEVLALCDRVVVLRHGRRVGERAIQETNTHDLATLMVGRELESPSVRTAPVRAATTCLAIEKLCYGQLRDFSLTVCAGEIVGVAGVDGNGQQELMEVLSSLRQPRSGRFGIPEGEPGGKGYRKPRVGLIAQDRHHAGLILAFDLAENMALHPALRAQCRTRVGFNWRRARETTRRLVEQFDVRTPAARGGAPERSLASSLSGGNQQKVVIARALSFPHDAVIAAEPTRGLDVGATQFVHSQLRHAAAAGAGVLLISTDLDEVLALSDRIGVLYEGRLLPGSELLPAGTDRTTIGTLMGGNTEAATTTDSRAGEGVTS
jgi:simple sugar transport system ATP-binding protein